MERKHGLGAFWRELRRRRVVRVGGVYVAAAFVALQLGEIVLPAFNAPDWVLQSVVVVAFLGLPVALTLAWAYELTPDGLLRTRAWQGRAGAAFAPRLALVGAVTVSAVLGALWFQRGAVTGDGDGGGGGGAAADGGRAGAGGEDGAAAGPAGGAMMAGMDPDAPIAAIAVLPLADFAEGDDLFARQLHGEIINQLGLLTTLRVVSRTSAERYANTAMLLPDIAAELGVQAVVEGSVSMAAGSDTVRITVQLVHAPSDSPMLSRSFQREMKDILRLQTEVAVEIAQAVQGELGEDEMRSAERVAAEVVDPEAYRAVLAGRRELERGTRAGLEAAEAHFDRAVGMDSGSLPLALRAGTRMLIAMGDGEAADEAIAAALGDVDRARALGGAEDEVAAAEVVAAMLVVDGEMEDSLRLAHILESTSLGRRFDRTSPLGTARRLLEAGRFDSAAAAFEALLEENPGLVPAWHGLEEALLRGRDYEGAVEAREDRFLAARGGTAAARAEAERLREAFDEDEPESYWRWRRAHDEDRRARGERVSHVELAATAVGLGEGEEAVRHLAAALRNREPGLVTLIRGGDLWDPLRSHPGFQEVVRDVRWLLRGARGAPERSPR